MEITLLNITLFFGGLAFIWYVHFWLYKEFVVDYFRQSMFELRDELFIEAHKGLIDFNHPAYCVLRRTMNGCIRFGHELGILQIITTSIVLKKTEQNENMQKNFSEEFKQSLSNLDDTTKNKLKKYKRRMNVIMFQHIIMQSPILSLSFCVALICMIIPMIIFNTFAKRIKQTLKNVVCNEIDSIQSEALAVGKM